MIRYEITVRNQTAKDTTNITKQTKVIRRTWHIISSNVKIDILLANEDLIKNDRLKLMITNAAVSGVYEMNKRSIITDDDDYDDDDDD